MTNFDRIKKLLDIGHKVRAKTHEGTEFMFYDIDPATYVFGWQVTNSISRPLMGVEVPVNDELFENLREIKPIPHRYKMLPEGTKVRVLEDVGEYWDDDIFEDLAGRFGRIMKTADNDYGQYYKIDFGEDWSIVPAWAVEPVFEEEEEVLGEDFWQRIEEMCELIKKENEENWKIIEGMFGRGSNQKAKNMRNMFERTERTNLNKEGEKKGYSLNSILKGHLFPPKADSETMARKFDEVLYKEGYKIIKEE